MNGEFVKCPMETSNNSWMKRLTSASCLENAEGKGPGKIVRGDNSAAR